MSRPSAPPPHGLSGHPPQWVEIAVAIDRVAHDALGAFLFDQGCTAVITEDAGDHTVKAYLPLNADVKAFQQRIDPFLRRLKQIFSLDRSPRLWFTRVADQDWDLIWRRFFRPTQATPDLLILPEWEPVPEPLNGHVIRMDPGPAFGTGAHATTRMCLQALEIVSRVRPWTLLDVGTGSGILAIYAAILGAKGVTGIDIDPEALRWAERNVRLNRIGDVLHLASTPVEAISGPFSVVCANLMLEEIRRLLDRLLELAAPGGWLILSGLLIEQEEAVTPLFGTRGIERQEVLHEAEWVCLMLRKARAV